MADEELKVTLDASGIDNGVDKAVAASIRLSEGFDKTAKVIVSFRETTKDTFEQVTKVIVDSTNIFGQKVKTTFESFKGELSLVSKAIPNVTTSLDAAAAAQVAFGLATDNAAKALKNQAEIAKLLDLRRNRDLVTSAPGGFPPVGPPPGVAPGTDLAKFRTEQLNLTNARRSLERLIELEGIQATTVARVFAEFASGNLTASAETDGLRDAVKRLIDAEEAYGKASRTASEQAIAAKQAEIDVEATRLRVAEESAREQIAAQVKLGAARLRDAELIRAEVVAEEAAVQKKLAVEEAYKDQRLVEIQQIFDAETLAQQQSAQREIASVDAKVAAHEIFIQQLNREIALEAQAASIQTVTRPAGFDITAGGTATSSQQNQVLAAEKALGKLLTAEKATLPQITADLAKVRAGFLDVGKAVTESEHAVVKLDSAQKNLGKTSQDNVSLLSSLSDSVINLFRIGAVSLFIGQLFRLQSVLEESVTRARDLSLALGQIATIEEGNVLSTTQWISSLRQLSESFGLPILDQAKAAYEALSNQIGEGAQTVKFLDAVNRLAITSLSTTTDASNLLASAINAFRLDADDAELVAAKLFRTVDLGRVKITELANIFGQSAVPAHLLGVSLDELLAAFDITTQQGIKTEQAQTLIRNILIKLIKPTEEMKKVFQELGVATGESAIKTFGFGKFLAILEERTKGSSEELGQLFGEIRATTGAMVFAADGADKYAVALDRTQKTTIIEFAAATAKVLQTTGEKFNIIGEQVKNFFEIEFGQHALKAIVDFIESMGGVNTILVRATETIKVLSTIALVALLGSLGSTVVATVASIPIFGSLSTVFASVAATSASAAASIDIFTVSVKAALVSMSVFSLALVAVASVAAVVSISIQALEDDFHQLELAGIASAKQQTENARVAESIIQTAIETQKRFLDSQIRVLLQGIAERRKALITEENDIKKHASEIDKALNLSTRRFNSELAAKITSQTNLFNAAKRDAESAATEIAKIFEETGKKQLTFDLDKAGPGQDIKILQAQIEASRAEADVAAQRGDIETFKRASKNIQDLTEQRFEAETKVAAIVGETNQKIAEQRLKLLDAQTVEEENAANAEIQRLNRHLRLSKTASELEIGFAERRQALIAKSNSGTAEEQIQALNALQQLTNEHARAVALANTEAKIRKEGLEDAQKAAQQYADLQASSLATAKAAEAQARALKAAQFTLDLLVKASDSFDTSFKKTLTDGTQEDINKQLQEQQERILRIINIQEQLGAGPESKNILLQQSNNLEEQAINELTQRRSDANVAAIEATRKRIDAQQKLEREANLDDIKRIEDTLNTINAIKVSKEVVQEVNFRLNAEQAGGLPESQQTKELVALVPVLKRFEDRLQVLKEGVSKLTTSTPSSDVEKLADQTRALLQDLRAVNISTESRRNVPALDALVSLRSKLEATSEALDNLTVGNKNIEDANKRLEDAVKKQTGKTTEQVETTERTNQTSQELIDTLIGSDLLSPVVPSTVKRIGELPIPKVEIADDLENAVELGVEGATPQVKTTVAGAVTQGVQAATPAVAQAIEGAVVEGFRRGRQQLPQPVEIPNQQPVPVTIAPATNGPAEAALRKAAGLSPGQDQAQALLDLIRQRGVVNPETGINKQQEIATRNNEETLRNLESLTQQNALLIGFLQDIRNNRSLGPVIQTLTPHLGFADGGKVEGKAGHDQVFARLSRGEFVMNERSTSRFLPTLMAMNTGRLSPRGFAEGGPVDVGGVHVTVNESSSPQATANAVMSKINRGIRQGTLKFYKGRN